MSWSLQPRHGDCDAGVTPLGLGVSCHLRCHRSVMSLQSSQECHAIVGRPSQGLFQSGSKSVLLTQVRCHAKGGSSHRSVMSPAKQLNTACAAVEVLMSHVGVIVCAHPTKYSTPACTLHKIDWKVYTTQSITYITVYQTGSYMWSKCYLISLS